MDHNLTIKPFRFDRCGYYKRKDKEVMLWFGGVKETFSDLKDWIEDPNKTLTQTKTYEFSDGDSVLGAYCVSCTHHEGDYIVMLWNKTHDEEAKIGCIDALKPLGQVSVHDVSTPNDTIPGYPTYFWIIPEANAYCTLVAPGRLNGNQAFRRYMDGFLDINPRHAVYEEAPSEDSGEVERVGYGHDNKQSVRGVYPCFRSYLRRTIGEIELMKRRLSDAKYVWRRKSIQHFRGDEREVAEKLFEYVDAIDEAPRNQRIKLEYKIETAIDEDFFDKLVSDAQQIQTEWDDIGIQYTGDSDVSWIANAVPKVKTVVDEDVGSNQLPDPERLYRELKRFRPRIISQCTSDG